MASSVTLDASPATLLRALRGSIVDARLAYPDVLHIEIRDGDGRLWRLATQDAQWSPSDPRELAGKSVADARVDQGTGELRLELSDGVLRLIPEPPEASDDPPNWELITPDGLLLEFGPGLRWRISDADAGKTLKGADALTERQREVLFLVAEGLTNKEIAERLLTTPRAVEHHVAEILSELGVRDRGEAAAHARRKLD